MHRTSTSTSRVRTALTAALALFALVMLAASSPAAAATKHHKAKHHATTCTEQTGSHAYASPDPSMEYLETTTLSCRSGAPWVLTIHGGSWINGEPSSVQNAVNLFYSHGWQVFNMEYRRGTDITWHEQEDDLIAARHWIVGHASTYGIDPDRGTAYGFSAGGHMAAWLGEQPQYGFASVVSLSGVLQPIRVCNAASGALAPDEPSTTNNVNLCKRETDMMGTAAPAGVGTDPAWDDFSPQTKITASSPATLMYQGTDDPAVPPGTADAFGYWLGQAGVTHTVVDVAGYGHTSATVYDSSTREEQMLDFVADHS